MKSDDLRTANLRVLVAKMVLSSRTSHVALLRMFQAGLDGRKEASEIGRKKYEENEAGK